MTAFPVTEVGIAAGACVSVGGVGLLGIAVSAATIGAASVKVAKRVKRKVWPSSKDDLEDLGEVVSMIYQKISRRCFMAGIFTAIAGGFIGFDIQSLGEIPEIFLDGGAGVALGVPAFVTLFSRRASLSIIGRPMLSAGEMKVLFVYEELVEAWISETLASPRLKGLIDKYESDTIRDLFAFPRFIMGSSDATTYIGGDSGAEPRGIIRKMHQENVEEMSSALRSREDSVSKAVGLNNLAAIEWYRGHLQCALDRFSEAAEMADSNSTLRSLIQRNIRVINPYYHLDSGGADRDE